MKRFYTVLLPGLLVLLLVAFSTVAFARDGRDGPTPRAWRDKTAAPTVNDDVNRGYRLLDLWYSGTSVYVCLGTTAGAANWQPIDNREGGIGIVDTVSGVTVTQQIASLPTKFIAQGASAGVQHVSFLNSSGVTEFAVDQVGNTYVKGNLGINTAVPSYLVDVNGGVVRLLGSSLYIQDSAPTFTTNFVQTAVLSRIYNNAAKDFAIGTNSSQTQLYLQSGGNVAIGTANVNANTKLDVQGLGSFTSGVSTSPLDLTSGVSQTLTAAHLSRKIITASGASPWIQLPEPSTSLVGYGPTRILVGGSGCMIQMTTPANKTIAGTGGQGYGYYYTMDTGAVATIEYSGTSVFIIPSRGTWTAANNPG